MLRLLYIGFMFHAMGIALQAEARTLEPTLPSAVLHKAGLALPMSATYLHMNGQIDNSLAELCPTPGFSLEIKRNASHENVSRALRMSFKNKQPEFDECIRESACSPMAAKEIKEGLPSGAQRFLLEGRASTYLVQTSQAAALPLKSLTCSSAAVEIKTNNVAELVLPRVIWLLNYGSRLVLFSDASQKTWLNISLPADIKFKKKTTSLMDAGGRLLVSDNHNFLMLDLQLDAAVLLNPNAVYKTRWGLASAALQGEWEFLNKSMLPFSVQQNESEQLFMLNGVAQGHRFWSWDMVLKLLKGEAVSPHELPGQVITAGEKTTGSERISTFATRDAEGTAQVSQFTSQQGKVRIIRNKIQLDPRAQKEHFVLLEDELYRFTADGLYKADSGSEKPTMLRGFKGFLKNKIQFLQSKEHNGKSCDLKIWSNKADFVGLFNAALSNLQCHQSDGLSVTPWSYASTWISGGQIKALVSAQD